MALNLVCAVLDRGPENIADMAVLLAIADSADKDTGEAWPSQSTIARRSRQTDRSVRNVLERLRAAGWLTWEARRRANGSRASNVYTINLEKLGESRTVAVASASSRSSSKRNHVPVATGTTFRGVPEPRSGYAPEPRSALEPSHHLEPSQSDDLKRRSSRFAPVAGSASDPQAQELALFSRQCAQHGYTEARRLADLRRGVS